MRAKRLLASQRGHRLEDARRDRRAGDRHAHRLEDLLGLDVEALDHARAAPARRSRRRTARPAPAPRAPRAGARARRRPSPCPRPCSSNSRRSTRKPASGQKSASVCIFSWLIATASIGSSRPVSCSRRAFSSSTEQLAQVAAVHPAQLLLVEDRRVLRHARQVEALDQLVGGEERGRLVVAPAEQGDVVAHRLGQVAGVAQLLDRRGAVALGELLAVGAVQQRQVGVARAAPRRARAGSSPGAACSRCGPRRARRG